MESVIHRLDRYKTEHQNFLLKGATTILELALWKANLDDKGEVKERELEQPGADEKESEERDMCYVSCEHYDQECSTLSPLVSE